jgi:hypothetical protein
MNLYKTSGYLSLVFGALCCIFIVLLVLTNKPLFLMLSLLNTFLGFVSSIINIFLNAKYEISKKKVSMGFAGLILSSVPVVFLMILILKR